MQYKQPGKEKKQHKNLPPSLLSSQLTKYQINSSSSHIQLTFFVLLKNENNIDLHFKKQEYHPISVIIHDNQCTYHFHRHQHQRFLLVHIIFHSQVSKKNKTNTKLNHIYYTFFLYCK